MNNELRIALIIIAVIIIIGLLVYGLRRNRPNRSEQSRYKDSGVKDSKFKDNDFTDQYDDSDFADDPLFAKSNDTGPLYSETAPEDLTAKITSPSADKQLNEPQQTIPTQLEADLSPPADTKKLENVAATPSQTDITNADTPKLDSAVDNVVAFKDNRAENPRVNDDDDSFPPLHIEPIIEPTTDPSTNEDDVAYVPANHALADYAGDPMIVTLHINAKARQSFIGADIETAFAAAGLTFGKKKIFHRLDKHGNSLFSVANQFEPGYFNPEDWENFYTDGIVCFAVLPNIHQSGALVFDDMLATSKTLAEALNGQLLDGDHNSVTMQSARYTRDEIAEFEHTIRIKKPN